MKLFALASSFVLLCSSQANAHLIAPRRATVHVVGNAIYSVVWLPPSALAGVARDREGWVTQTELFRDRSLVDRLGERWILRDGSERARTRRVDLFLQPPDGAPGDRAPEVVMLHHATFARPPRSLEIETDLFGDPRDEPEMTVSASGDLGARVVTMHPPHDRKPLFVARPVRRLFAPLVGAGFIAIASIAVFLRRRRVAH